MKEEFPNRPMYTGHQSIKEPMKLFCRSQWPRGLRRGSEAARLLRIWVRIPPKTRMFVPYKCCVLSEVFATCRSLVQGSSTECGVSECDRETSITRRPSSTTAIEP
jgi:hypothetical protein